MFPYESLEKEFSKYIGVKDCVTTNTGTAALHLAIEGKHYPSGSEVIVPEFSMIATALAPYYARCVPVPVDCKQDMNINPLLIEEKITDKTVAIVVTHVYGRICEMEPILAICNKYNLDLFEDCCEVHGATYIDGPQHKKMVGSLGVGCFSFYRNKIVRAEEGGAVCVRDDRDYANHLSDLKNMSFGANHDYIHNHIGFNYRMADSQAEKARSSLRSIKTNLAFRSRVARMYDENLNKKFIRSKRSCTWVYDINCSCPDMLVNHLNELGIAARRTFAPMSLQPCFGVSNSAFDLVSYKLYMNTCYLPVTPHMIEKEVKYICEEVNKF